LWDPTIARANDFSLSQLWVTAGSYNWSWMAGQTWSGNIIPAVFSALLVFVCIRKGSAPKALVLAL
jgi:hypothetical protein